MTGLGSHLQRLGLELYHDVFVREGFDTWETLLDIQESDFDRLNVKLGHRRKLQRAIADYRGIPYERLVASSVYEAAGDGGRQVESPQRSSLGNTGGVQGPQETKRKYRRHAKADENAPERPPSAYVIFSNKVREEVKNQNLSFTQIAKLVGDRWQKLDPTGKEPYESQANAAKERYNIQLSTYKKTDAYKEYVQYLAEFKAKHGGTAELKRPKLDPETSTSTVSTKSEVAQEPPSSMQRHVRVGSTGSVSSISYTAAAPSPASHQGPGLPLQPHAPTSNLPQRIPLKTSRSGSPPQLGRPLRQPSQVSNQSSISDESPAARSDSDALIQAASLSLSTPPTGTPPLSLSSVPPGEYASHDLARGRYAAVSNQPISGTALSQAQASTAVAFFQTLSSPALSEGSYHSRGLDARGYLDSVRSLPLPQYAPSAAAPTHISLPPLMASDRVPDFGQRILPPPRSSPTSMQPGYQPPRFPESPAMPVFGLGQRPPRPASTTNSPLERSESDAADALAGLSAGVSRPETTKPVQGHWPGR